MPGSSEENIERLRYPIGRFEAPERIDCAQRQKWIDEIERLPGRLRDAVADLSDFELDTTYRPGGWSVRQVVHHLPDSHMNSYVRFRLALTEENPNITSYLESAWAELEDARTAPVQLSLALLEALHKRWVILLRSMDNDNFARSFRHPQLGEMTLARALGLYAWHGQHHVAQISSVQFHNAGPN